MSLEIRYMIALQKARDLGYNACIMYHETIGRSGVMKEHYCETMNMELHHVFIRDSRSDRCVELQECFGNAYDSSATTSRPVLPLTHFSRARRTGTPPLSIGGLPTHTTLYFGAVYINCNKHLHAPNSLMANLSAGKADPIVVNKAISAAHATATSIAACLILKHWPSYMSDPNEPSSKGENINGGQLDDSENPTIIGRNYWANALTTWETAYLLYDTYAMISAHRRKYHLKGNRAAFSQVITDAPVLLVHHLLLASAFLVLQAYIAAGKEKGMWIITSLMLMNSSNPLMHARWWRKQRTGKSSLTLDFAFLVTFAASRFGLIVWIMRKYGRHHDIGPWKAFTMLRKTCQLGTGLLVGMNGVWWTVLLLNILKRRVKSRRT